LEGCLTQGDTLEELYKMCAEALNLYLDEPSDSKIIFPLPDEILDNNKKLAKIMVKPERAFAVLLRNYRLNANMAGSELTGEQLARLMREAGIADDAEDYREAPRKRERADAL
jgi:predicted RNase H-like HicB family nuclease